MDAAKFDDAYFKPTEKKDKKKGEAVFFQVGTAVTMTRALNVMSAVALCGGRRQLRPGSWSHSATGCACAIIRCICSAATAMHWQPGVRVTGY